MGERNPMSSVGIPAAGPARDHAGRLPESRQNLRNNFRNKTCKTGQPIRWSGKEIEESKVTSTIVKSRG